MGLRTNRPGTNEPGTNGSRQKGFQIKPRIGSLFRCAGNLCLQQFARQHMIFGAVDRINASQSSVRKMKYRKTSFFIIRRIRLTPSNKLVCRNRQPSHLQRVLPLIRPKPRYCVIRIWLACNRFSDYTRPVSYTHLTLPTNREV